MVCTRKSSACGVCIWEGARNVWREAHRVDPCVTGALCVGSPGMHFVGGEPSPEWGRRLFLETLGEMSEDLGEFVCPCASELLRRV